MATGMVALVPTNAYAVVPEVKTSLAQAQTTAGTAVVFGSSVVWDTQRSADTGATWVADPALTTPTNWDFIGGGKMVRIVQPGGTNVVVYTPGTGAVTKSVPSVPYAVNASYASLGTSLYNFASATSTPLTQPTGTATYWTQELTGSNAVLWHGLGADSQFDLFAASPSPSVAAGAWVAIPGYQDYMVTDTDFYYTMVDASAVKLCRIPLASMSTTAAVCVTVASGNYTTGYNPPTVTNLGSLILVSVTGSTDLLHTTDKAFVVTTTTSAVAQVALPAGSWLGNPIQGGAPYITVHDANTVPTVKVVATNGSLSAGFAIPQTRTVKDYFLAVAPNRVDGADPRDGSISVPVWSRAVSSSGFGSESILSRRASDVLASAGRTAIMGRDGLSIYDRGSLTYTFADAALIDVAKISGPYVAEQVAGGTVDERTVVSKADGTAVKQFTGWPVALFGSQYVETTDDAVATGAKHVVVRDLTGVLADATHALPAGTAGCVAVGVWGTRIALYCPNAPWTDTSRVYDYITGALIGSTTGLVESMGDGYAMVSLNNTYEVWNLAAKTLDVVTGCLSLNTVGSSDGVGHVVCQSATQLIWRDYSSLSTSAGRVLGWMAPSSFATGSWTPQLDVTKAFSAGTLRISQGTTIVKDIPVPASVDGSLRGVSWNGTNTAGAVAAVGSYTATLLVSGADGTGAVKAIDGVAAPTFPVSWTGGAAGAPGSFTALTPSRLLDTRDGTGVAAPGAVPGNSVIDVQVTGRGGVPATGVGAVILNVTAVTPAGSGFLTVYPSGGAVPNASNLNFTAGQVVPNLVVAKLGANGKVSIRNTSPGATHVVADVAGYFVDGTVTDPGGLTAVSPSRLLDTRNTGVVAANSSVKVQAAGLGGVPATGVAAVVVNLTAVTPAASGFLTAYPTGGAVPNASNVNFTAGQVVPNLAFVKLAADGSFTVQNSSPGATHVVADVAGYVLAGTVTGAGMFVALSPTRILDTRPAYGGSGAIGGNAGMVLTVAGAGGVPATGVSGVVLNVTAVATAAGFLTVYPADVGVPNASNLNFTAGQVVPNLVAVKTSAPGAVAIRNSSLGATNVIADVAGYFTG